MNSTNNTLWIIIIMWLWWVCDAKEDYDSYIVFNSVNIYQSIG